MPIRQLRNKDESDHGFTTHDFGSIIQPRPKKTARPLEEVTSWGDLFGGSSARGKLPAGRPRKNRRHLTGRLIRVGLILFLIGGIFVVTVFAWYSKDLPDPNKIIERDIAQSTKIYDRTGGVLLYEIHGTERRTLIELSDIPQYAIDATISVEDKNFFKHKGLSLTGIARAFIYEILSKVGLFGGNVPGGSTLTQQFIKNAVLTTEKSYIRKIKEFVLAYRMEKKFSKSEILKMYFNEIPYGSTAYGIEAASHIYFDKPAKDLTIGEAAILAALPQAPSYYSPYGSHKDELISRQRFVLKLMVEQGYLTQDQAESARNEKIVFKIKREDMKAPHFVLMVKEELSQRYGERLVEQGGLSIITTLDADKQKIAEDTINELAPGNVEKYNANNASLVTVDTATGDILAMVGSRDYFDDSIDGQVNVATSPRQPGSSIKPVVYAAAFNKGYRPDTILFDLVTPFAASGRQYRPLDYDGKERGPVSLRQALQGSLNIPAVKLLYLVGVNNAVKLAQDLGYTTLTDPDRYGLSLVLGGAEVKLVEHTNAFATFAREGIYKPTVDVLKVTDSSGTVLEESSKSGGKRALPREVVRTLENVLSDNAARAFIFGVGNHLTLPGRPVATKTGTTNDYHDAWTIGFTPSIATGVWVGNSDNTEMKKGADGSVVAAPIWQKYMTKILEGTPVEGFKAPESLPPCNKPMLCGQIGNQRIVEINGDNGKLASPYTPLSKIKEVTYREVHEILQYVDKNDPTGPEPTNPSDDPQYQLWEPPVKKWAESQGFVTEQPPTETDDAYRAEDQPSISFTSLSNNATLTGENATFSVSASGPHQIDKVTYYLNNVLLDSSTQAPYSYTFTPTPATPNGTYTLMAAATDVLGNEKQTSITVQLSMTPGAAQWGVTWSYPQDQQTVPSSSAPSSIVVNVKNPEQIKKIDFYSKLGGSPSYIGYQDVNGNALITQPWTPPQTSGSYQLYMVITDANNTVVTLPAITITITP